MTGSDANALLARLVARLEGDVLFTMHSAARSCFTATCSAGTFGAFPACALRCWMLCWEVPPNPPTLTHMFACCGRASTLT